MSLSISTDSTFAENTKNGLVFVDFWASWCGPCQMMLPRLQNLDEKFAGKVTIMKHNVDEEPEIAGKFGIRSIPTMMLFHDGKMVETVIGVQSEESLATLFNKYITDTSTSTSNPRISPDSLNSAE